MQQPLASNAERRDLILQGLPIDRLSGIEFGALDKPLVRRADGPIVYVDHCHADKLRQTWANDPSVDVQAIQVDVVWGGQLA